MKKNEIEIEKYFIDYLVKTIKDKNLSSLEVTRTLSDKHKLKIKINNSVSSPKNQEYQTIKVENSSWLAADYLLAGRWKVLFGKLSRHEKKD